MSDATKPATPLCPQCGKPLELNGIDEQHVPPVAVFACPSCNVNFTGRLLS